MMRFSRALTRPSATARVIRQSRGLVVPSQSHKAQEAAVRRLSLDIGRRWIVLTVIELWPEEGIPNHRSRVRPLPDRVIVANVTEREWD